VVVNIEGECGRKGYRRIQLDTLLETVGDNGEMPFEITDKMIYVPIPWKELCRRRSLMWFLRMSEEQIEESELVIAALLRM
jgi:hypothetical protein